MFECMTGGIHTNVCKFFIFTTYIFSADVTPDMLKLCRVTNVKVLFLVLVYVFNFNLFLFSAVILEKVLLLIAISCLFQLHFAQKLNLMQLSSMINSLCAEKGFSWRQKIKTVAYTSLAQRPLFNNYSFIETLIIG